MKVNISMKNISALRAIIKTHPIGAILSENDQCYQATFHTRHSGLDGIRCSKDIGKQEALKKIVINLDSLYNKEFCHSEFHTELNSLANYA